MFLAHASLPPLAFFSRITSWSGAFGSLFQLAREPWIPWSNTWPPSRVSNFLDLSLNKVSIRKLRLIVVENDEYVLRPKMNCTVRFGKQFSESSPCLPGQQGTGQQGWYASGTLRKQFTKPTVQFILGRSMCDITRGADLYACIRRGARTHMFTLL